jgi:multiple sugar transport system substrate-binding protein
VSVSPTEETHGGPGELLARWDGATIDGGIYGVPGFMFVDWMYYRADWFEEAGLDPPTTFEEFTGAAIAMTDPENGRYGFGMRGGNGGQGFVTRVIEAFGSPIIDEDGQPAMDFDKAVEGLRWYTDLHTVHGAVPPGVANDSFRQLMEAFQTGQTAMLWHHTGSLTEMRTVLGDEGVFSTAVRPAGSAALIASATPGYNGISAPGPGEEDAAWEWIRYWAEVNTQVNFLELTGYFPSSALVADDERVQTNPLYAAALATVNEVGPPTRFPGSPGWERNVVLPTFQRVLLGEITPEEGVEVMMAGLEEAVNG